MSQRAMVIVEIFVLLAFVAAGVLMYLHYFPIKEEGFIAQEDAVKIEKIKETLTNINAITLDRDILTHSYVDKLNDIRATVPEEPLGVENPFSPAPF